MSMNTQFIGLVTIVERTLNCNNRHRGENKAPDRISMTNCSLPIKQITVHPRLFDKTNAGRKMRRW